MKLEIDFLSTEVVTPSSPTPPHLNRYNLSLLDQTMPPYFIPIYLFYQAKDNLITYSQKSSHLKKSLSQALTLFYPLAGRLIGNSYVNCNDDGVTFIEAKANCKLDDVITDPIPEELNKFVPCDLDGGMDHCCLVVQATIFRCGGLVIGLKIPHKLVDGVSYFMFVNSWAAISRGDDASIQFPKFESAVLFPPIDLGGHTIAAIEEKTNIVTKRFVFTAQKIADLREKYYTKNKHEQETIGLSRTEILTAFIWTRFMVSTGNIYAIRIFVDIRTKVVPPLSEFNFGNIIFSAITLPSLENNNNHTYGVVKKVRDAIRNVDRDYVVMKNSVETEAKDEVVTFRFSSLCKLPVYKSDFGWGLPVWFGIAKIPRCNIVFFVNTLSGGGIEAWVNLKKEDMDKFEVDEELLEYVSFGDDVKYHSRI